MLQRYAQQLHSVTTMKLPSFRRRLHRSQIKEKIIHYHIFFWQGRGGGADSFFFFFPQIFKNFSFEFLYYLSFFFFSNGRQLDVNPVGRQPQQHTEEETEVDEKTKGLVTKTSLTGAQPQTMLILFHVGTL